MIFDWQEQPWKAWTRLRERLPHAILIQSGEGLGEFEFAHACAQSLLCERPQPDQRACGACHACNWFSLGNHPDFRLIVPESMAPESREEGAEPSKKRRSEEHTSELQSRPHLVCRLLLEKKKTASSDRETAARAIGG